MDKKNTHSFQNQEQIHSSPVSENLEDRLHYPFLTDYMNAPLSDPTSQESEHPSEPSTPSEAQ